MSDTVSIYHKSATVNVFLPCNCHVGILWLAWDHWKCSLVGSWPAGRHRICLCNKLVTWQWLKLYCSVLYCIVNVNRKRCQLFFCLYPGVNAAQCMKRPRLLSVGRVCEHGDYTPPATRRVSLHSLVCVTTAVSFPVPCLCHHGCIFPCSLSVWLRLYLPLFLVCMTAIAETTHQCLLSHNLVCLTIAVSAFPVPCMCDYYSDNFSASQSVLSAWLLTLYQSFLVLCQCDYCNCRDNFSVLPSVLSVCVTTAVCLSLFLGCVTTIASSVSASQSCLRDYCRCISLSLFLVTSVSVTTVTVETT